MNLRPARRLFAAAALAAATGMAVPASGGILSGFKNSLIEFALDQISVPDTLEIAAEEIQDPEEGFVRLLGVTISDKNGVWMKVGELVVDWDVSRVLRAELELNNLIARDVEVLRSPNPEDVDVQVKEGSELDQSLGGIFDWPRSPIDTRIDSMRLENVFIAEGVIAEQSIRFEAEGSARDEGKEQAIKLEVVRTDDVVGSIDLDYLRDFDANTLTLLLQAAEEPDGLVAEMAGFPNDATSALVIDAQGPLTEWQLDFAASTEGVFQAEGQAVVSTSEPFSVVADFSLDPGPNMDDRLRRVLGERATLSVRMVEDEDGTIRIERGEISSPELTLDASGFYARRTDEVSLKVDLDAEAGLAEAIEGVELGRFKFQGEVAGTTEDLTAKGRLDLAGLKTAPVDVGDATLEATVTVTGPRIAAELEGEVGQLRLDKLSAEAIGTARINGGIVYDNDVVELKALQIESDLLDVIATGSFDLTKQLADLEYRLSSRAIAEVAAAYGVDASGTAEVSGRLTGPLDAPKLVGQGDFGDLTYAGDSYGQVRITHDIELGQRPRGTVDLTASGTPWGPLTVDTAFVLTEEELRLTQMRAEAMGVSANGRATVLLAEQLVNGELEVEAPDLTAVGAWLNQPISGGANGQVTLMAEDGEQMATAALALAGFSGFGVKVGEGSLDAKIDDALGTPAANATLDVRNIDAYGVFVGAAEGTVASVQDGKAAELALTLSAIEAAGVNVPTARVEGTITEPFGEIGLDLAVDVPGVSGDLVSAEAIEGAIAATPGLAQVDVDLTATQLAIAGAEAGRARIDATVTGIDRPDGMQIAADLALDGLEYQDVALGRFEGHVETTEALEAVQIQARLTGVTGEDGLSVGTASIDGVIRDPLGRPAADAELTVVDLAYKDDRIGRLSGRIEMPADEEVVVLDVTATDFSVAGIAGSRAVLDGTVRDPFSDLPKVDAKLAVDGMAYQDIRLGRLSGTVDSSDDGQEVALDLSLSGVEGEGLKAGEARVTGTLTDPLGQPAISADLSVRDIAYQDVTLAELTGTVRTTPERDRVTLDVTLRELAGQGLQIARATIDGAVADPFGDRPKPTAEVVVEGLAYGEDEIGTVRGTVTTSENAERIDVDIRLVGTETGTGAARAVIDATIRDPYGEPLIDADVDIAALRLGDLLRIERMDGKIATTGEGEAIDVDLTLAGVAGAGARVDSAVIDGTVTDPFGEPAVQAQVSARGVAYGDQLNLGSLEGTVNSLEGMKRVAVDMTASDFSGYDVRFKQARVDGVVLDALSKPGFVGEVSAEAFAYRDDLTIGRIAGTVDAAPGLEEVEVDAGFRDLKGYGVTIAGGQLNGVVTGLKGVPGFQGEFGLERFGYADELSIGRLSGVVYTDDATGAIELDVNVGDLQGYGLAAVSGDIAGTVTDPTGTPGFDGEVRARQLRYGEYRVERVQADIAAPDLSRRARIDARITGASGGGLRLASAEIDATVDDPLGTPTAEVRLDARNAAFAGNAAARLQAQATLTGLTTGALGAEGTATASGVSAGGGRIGSVELSYDLADLTGAPTGTLDGVARDIAIAGVIAARGDLDVDLTAAGGRSNAKAAITLSTVDLGLATVDQLALNATVSDLLGPAPVLSLRAESSAADFGFARLGGGLLSADGPLSALRLALSTSGERLIVGGDPVPLVFEATARLDGTRGLSGQLTSVELVLGDDRIALNAPLRLGSAGGATTLQELDLALPGGTLKGDLAIHPSGLVGDLVLTVTDPRPLARQAGLPEMSGTIRASAQFDTRPGSARAVVAVDGTGLQFQAVDESFGALGLDLDLVWDGRTAQTTLALTGPFAQPVQARLAFPLRPTGGLIPAVPADASVDGALVWQGDIGTIWPLVPLTDHVLDGPLNIDLRVSGPIGGPQVAGQVAMRGGRYENLEFGTILTDVDITTELRSTDAFTVNLTARDAASAVVRGRVTIGPGGLDAQVTASDAILVRRDDVTAAVTLDVTARGPLNSPTVAGRIGIDRAEVRLINLTPPTVATLGEVRIKGAPRKPPSRPAGGAIALNLSIVAPDDIYIRGRGLDSEWRADLAVRGTAADPSITGAIERIRGELTLIGREFELEEGLIDFDGRTPINPRLNVRLVRDSEDVSGGIWVRGTARDVEVEFFSEPALPEDEVLPRVLFGRSQQSLSPVEAVQLAAGVAQLLDGTGGALDEIRSALGVDVLRVGGDGETTTVTVGTNIADDVFVGVEQPIGGGSPSVKVEIEVFDNFDIESEVGGAKGSSVGVQWKKDF